MNCCEAKNYYWICLLHIPTWTGKWNCHFSKFRGPFFRQIAVFSHLQRLRKSSATDSLCWPLRTPSSLKMEGRSSYCQSEPVYFILLIYTPGTRWKNWTWTCLFRTIRTLAATIKMQQKEVQNTGNQGKQPQSRVRLTSTMSCFSVLPITLAKVST
jgi:hypothetical protein